MSSRHSNISDTSSKIRDAKANAAARKIEMIAQKEQLEREEELDEIQNILNRKKRELEQQRLSVLLRVEEAKLQVYEDTHRENMKRGVLGSGSQLYSTINKRQEVHLSTPMHQDNPEIVERQMASSKSDVMLIAEAMAASVNANRIPVPEPSVFNGDPLEYPDWKASFYALIENRGIPSQENGKGWSCRTATRIQNSTSHSVAYAKAWQSCCKRTLCYICRSNWSTSTNIS